MSKIYTIINDISTQETMAKYEIKNGVWIIPEGTTCIESYAFQTGIKEIIVPAELEGFVKK